MTDDHPAFAATQAEDDPPRERGLISLDMRTSVLPRRSEHAALHSGARFEPIEVIGRGGLGEVTLARDHDIDRPVAIKRLRGAVGDDQLERFAHEVRTIGRLEHPNITPVYDVGVDDAGQHYFVMRYVQGETLEAVIAHLASGDPDLHRTYSFARRIEVFLGILHAVQYAHEKGIVHRDIKPANVMIGPYGEVMLMDWGIAKQRDAPALPETGAPVEPTERTSGTRAGALIGTPLYMSPEQAAGDNDRVDERSDVYALSVVFYELLSLRHYLLPGVKTVDELLAAIRTTVPTRANYLRSDHQPPVPTELGWYIDKGMAKDPADRYQSVAEMIAALEQINSGACPIQCSTTLVKRAGNEVLHFVDKEPKAAKFALVAIAILSLIGVIAIVRWIIS